MHHLSWHRKSGKSCRKNSVAPACFDGLGAAPRHTKKGCGDAASNTNSTDRFARTNRETKDVTTTAGRTTRRELRTQMNVGERGEKKDHGAATVRIYMKIYMNSVAMISPGISERVTEIPASVCRDRRASPARYALSETTHVCNMYNKRECVF